MATTKKKTAYTPKNPPLALRKAAMDLFDEHGWPGNVVGRRSLTGASDATDCPDGKTPHDITFQKEDGTWVTQTVCL